MKADEKRSSRPGVPMLMTALLLVLILIATVTDLARQRIYNWTTYSGILAALGLNSLGSVLLATTQVGSDQLESLGWIGWDKSCIGLVACGLLMLVCFVTFKVAGGDVKLIAMIGAFVGPEQGLETLLWTFVLGMCMGLILLIWRVGPWRMVVLAFRPFGRLVGWQPLHPPNEEEREILQLPLFLAPNALVAAVLVRFSLLEEITSII
ncbi:MAG: prepilin peptidase [Candidatus Nealsonbacteria bacterium]|nr:prepilin peptidase [Candidatus Nealsonbacteria bacterium]